MGLATKRESKNFLKTFDPCLQNKFPLLCFFKIEEKVNSQVLHWEDESVKKLIEDEIASKVGFIR